MENWRNCME